MMISSVKKKYTLNTIVARNLSNFLQPDLAESGVNYGSF